jgi:hypothetical protein
MFRWLSALVVAVLSTFPLSAQPVNLTEKNPLGERANYAIELDLKGNLFVALENGKQPIPLEAKAKHRFAERCIAVTDGMPSSSARYYSEATATVTIATDKTVRSLANDRKLIVARRNADGEFCFSPNGPMTRDELDLVTDHFNPQCLPGLLPGKVVNGGDTWTLTELAVQAACRFDVVIKAALTGKLTEVKEGVAAFTIEGTAEGLENGAKVSLSVSARGTYDVASGHITSLSWKQKDEREQGSVNPASQVEVTIALKRENPSAESKELSDEVLAGIPEGNPVAKLTDLRLTDVKGRYQISHSREWYVTGQTDTHLIMRLLDRGELLAQATVTVWNKMDPGKHLDIEDFKKAVNSAPGWTAGKVIDDRELPGTAGRWLYRLSIEGKMENVPVVQTFFLLAGPQGDQLVITVASRPESVKALADRDLNLVKSIEFGKK